MKLIRKRIPGLGATEGEGALNMVIATADYYVDVLFQ